MSDLRDLVAPLFDRPLVAAPPLEAVAERARTHLRRRRRQNASVALAFAVLISAMSWTVREHRDSLRTVGRPGTPALVTGSTSTTAPSPALGAAGSRRTQHPAPTTTTVAPGAVPDGTRCEAGANGGATDRGVTAQTISILMSSTDSGAGASMYHDAGQVVFDSAMRVNRAGGICGRILKVVAHDGFVRPDQQTNTFAFFVGPGRPELDDYITSGDAERIGVPVVGTDGLTAAQFQSPLVWPVGTPWPSMVRIAVDHDYRVLGARTFALLFDDTFAPGTEAAAAFEAYVPTLPGASIKLVQPSGATDAALRLKSACGGAACDAVVWAGVDAQRWLGSDGATGRLETDDVTSMGSSSLTQACGSALSAPCDSVRVWARYTPAVGSFLNEPAVQAYGQVAKDGANAFVEGAYVGFQLLVEALKRTGPNLTRARLRDTLDHMTFDVGLTTPLSWGPTRVANTSARALKIVNGHFEDAGGGWVRDPLAN